jgi:transcriptional regulator with XRE-family HTH domain
MSEAEQTFGRAISQARKKLGWSQKELASKVRREDGEAISPQYLNDIEHDRRSPSSDHMVQQFAETLELAADWLYYLAGRFPADVRGKNLSEKEVKNLMVAFRRDPKRK